MNTKQELPPGVVAAVAVVVVLVLGLVGWSFLKPKSNQMTEEETKATNMKIEDQYKQFGPRRPQGR